MKRINYPNWRISFVVLTLTLSAFVPAPAAVQLSSIPEPNAWVTDGLVSAIVTSDNMTYIGGFFNYVGPNTGKGVPMDSSGLPFSTYPKVNGAVNSCIPDGSGGWYIGGEFNRVGSVERNHIAHILSNGSVDDAWNPDANGLVFALAISGTTVYVGGNFTSIGGHLCNHIAAIDYSGSITDWNPDANDIVIAIVVSGTTVYAGGAFTTIGGQ
nr:hypothetical protein [Prolixibacteraceae bacterium]